jgi:beta-lactamase regulating signal transducer with metallopeptidase domain
MLPLILEAALRSTLMAAAVWAGIRLLRVHHVLAQKVAWVLVLLAAGIMPFVMRAPIAASSRALKIPANKLSLSRLFRQALHAATVIEARNEKAQIDLAGAGHQQGSPAIAHARVAKHEPSQARHFAAKPSPSVYAEPHHAVSQPAGPASAPTQTIRLTAPAANLAPIPVWNLARIASFIAIAYCLVSGILLLRTLAGLAIAWRFWLRAKPVSLAHVALEDAASLKIRVTRDLATPVTIGRTILLPADFRHWDEEKLRVVLAHEQSHVYQRDFYLQLLAAVHAAIFWFSPMGWWLQRKLSDLGEALSDRAGLAQATDSATYAQILLEFAAVPHPTFSTFSGVAMARSSNLSARIERILNSRRFRLAFLGGRRHAIFAAILAPSALVATVALIRVVPAVEAAASANTVAAVHFQRSASGQATAAGSSQGAGVAASADAVQAEDQADEQATGEISADEAGQVTTMNVADSQEPAPAPPAPEAAPAAPEAEAPEPPSVTPQAPAPPAPPKHGHGFAYVSSGDDGDDSFAIIQGGNGDVHINHHSDRELQKAREQYGDNFIWFERDGKSYIITDPAIIARSKAMFATDPALERQQAKLEQEQHALELKMDQLNPDKIEIKLDSAQFKDQMAKLNAQLAELNKVKIKEITDKVTMETLNNLQEKMGEIQGQIGEIQGKIGEEQGKLGEKQGELGEQMGKIGEQMGKIGEEEGKQAEEASRKMKSVLDQAIRDGKAKPIN